MIVSALPGISGIVDSTSVPTLRLGQIQTCGLALVRWAAWCLCIAPGSLHVLLAAILLLFHSRRRMIALQPDSRLTSNDLLLDLVAKQSQAEMNYQIVAQSAEDIQDLENASAVSIGPYLLNSGQIQLLTTISVYSLRGESREQMRLLFMNAAAIRVWEEMGKEPKVIGTRIRPHHAALLAFGVPFSR
jgi:hypothetical protein